MSTRPHRRVAGTHDLRLDGMADLYARANGARVLDVGANRGWASYEMARNGAVLCHGIDEYEPGMQAATEIFTDLRAVESLFIVGDLCQGADVFKPFGGQKYDIVMWLATVHKLKRVMSHRDLKALFLHTASLCEGLIAWRATSDKPAENEAELAMIDEWLYPTFKIVHRSTISEQLGLCAVWRRQ